MVNPINISGMLLEDRLEELESRLDEVNQVLELDNHEENNEYDADEVCEQCYEEECSCEEDDEENDFDNDDQDDEEYQDENDWDSSDEDEVKH